MNILRALPAALAAITRRRRSLGDAAGEADLIKVCP
jgi:hypothetical protein